MLALTRDIGERVIITAGPYKIEVMISRVRRNQVTLAFDAPKEVGIDRQEVYLEKRADAAAKEAIRNK